MQRLGKNLNGYLGDTLDINSVLAECTAAADQHFFTTEKFPVSGKPALLAFTRRSNSPESKSIYISAGIHGDEPAGPLAVKQLLQDNLWPAHVSVSILPCLNPTGFPRNSRENIDGIDLNREFLNPRAEEIRALLRWLESQPAFDLCLCLHEDWESHGFYLYELNPEKRPSPAEKMIEQVSLVCPIDPSPVIEGREANQGIIRPSLDPRTRPLWPESFYLLTHKTRLTCTLEAPSDFPLTGRVAALVTAVRAALEFL